MAQYTLPEKQIEDLQQGWISASEAEDILVRLRRAGEPRAELEERIAAMKEKYARFAEAFDVELT